jgi:hypothetical protein
MKKYIAGIIILLFGFNVVFGQDEAEPKTKDKPVRSPFEHGMVIDNQTCVIPAKNTLEWMIQHRFGAMENGIHDVFGLYAPGANIRNGFNYSILDNLQVGYGLMLKNMTSDFSAKYAVLQQTRENKIPVAVTLFANMAIDGRDKNVYGTEYKGSDRLSYFYQLIVGRKFCDAFTLQVNGSFSHYNSVDSTMNHDVFGIGFNGRVKFTTQSSFVFQYDIPLKIQAISEQSEFDVAKPNFGIGYEVSTGSHMFQIYITSSNGILPQDNYMYNQFDLANGFSDLMVGFTITRLWGF